MAGAAALCVVILLLSSTAQASDADKAFYDQRADVRNFIAAMVEKHGFTSSDLQGVFADAEFQPSVVKAMEPPRTPAVRSWERYRTSFVNQNRINRGVKFMRDHAQDLQRAQQRYGVPAEIIAAIIGVETIYGQNVGGYRVLDALTTLAFDYPRRADYFRGELEQYLLLVREQNLSYASVLGSYAGAIGLPQFMPTNVRLLGVDFDGDGHVDLRNSVVDAIGSVAHYLAVHGWQADAPVAERIVFDQPVPAAWLESIQPVMVRDDIKQVGYKTRAALDDKLGFAVIPLETPGKPSEYWLGFHNFYVITRYNKSSFYAMSVFQLAQALNARR